MPKTMHMLQVLVSSPSDVSTERKVAQEVVGEVNRLLAADSCIQLQSLVWEADVASGIGGDAQEVINAQLPQYDCYLGIMWTRFGTPTPRAGSGTEEEFERAVKRWQESPESVNVMFYFSNAQFAPSSVDPMQFAAVRQFRDRVISQGVLAKEYADLDQFRAILLQDLFSYAKSWEKKPARGSVASAAAQVIDDQQMAVLQEIDEDSELDVLDYMVSVEEASEKYLRALDAMNVATTDLGGKLERRTAEMLELTSGGSKPSPKQAWRVTNLAADDLNDFAEVIENNLPAFREGWGTYIDTSSKLLSAASAQEEAEVEPIREARNQLGGLDTTMEGTVASVSEFREAIAGTPRLTSHYKRAARRAMQAVDDLVEEIRKSRSFLPQLMASLDQMIDKYSDE